MRLSPRTWSVGTQTFLGMLVVSLLLSWLGTTLFSTMVYQIQQEHIAEDVDKRTALFSTTLLDALLSEDVPVLETTLQGLTKIHTNLMGAEFCDYRNRPLLRWGSEVPSCLAEGDSVVEALLSEQHIMTSRREIIYQGERFGAIALRWNLKQPFAALDAQIEQFFLILIAAVLFLALILFVMVRWLVVFPIRKVDHFLTMVQTHETMDQQGVLNSSQELSNLYQGVLGLQQSMADEAKLREEREQLLVSLEDKVAARTSDLKRSNEQLSSIMENMRDELFVLNEQGEVLVSNPAARRRFPSLAAQPQQATHFRGLFAENQAEQLEQLLATTSPSIATLLLLDKEREKLFLELSISPLPIDPDHRHQLILIRDVTEQHDLEEKEQMIAFQSGIAEISANIMHNIGNALAGMGGHLIRLNGGKSKLKRISDPLLQLSEKADELPVEKFSELLKSSSAMVESVRNGELEQPIEKLELGINKISRVIRLQKSNSRPIFQLSRFHPSVFLKEVTEVVESAQKSGLIEVSIEVDDALNEVYLPRNQLFQVLVSLLVNSVEAIKARQDQQPGEITLRLFSELRAERPGITITLQDNGVGVEKSRLPTLFSSSSTTKHQGEGAGLHASGNFVLRFGGEIALDSDGVGKGATVNLWLPMKRK